MPDAEKILSQNEVDALLSAIGSGEVEVAPEISSEPQAVGYDFKRPQRVTRDQLRALETLHENFARNLQAALTSLLRSVTDVKINRVDQISFQEYIHSLPNPTVLMVLSAQPLEGNFVLELNPSIAFPMVERLLGSGKIGGPQPERAFTPIEWNLIGTVTERVSALLADAWSIVVPVKFAVTGRESDPPLARVYSPNEAMVAVSLEVSIAEHRGIFNLAFPVMMLEGKLDELAAHEGLSSKRSEPAAGQEVALSTRLAPAEVVLMAHLPIEGLSMKSLRTLRPGDVLQTNHPREAPVILSVEGRQKFQAAFGGLKDRKAVKVTGPVEGGRSVEGAAPRSLLKVRPAEEGGTGGEQGGEEEVRSNLLQIGLTESVIVAEKSLSIREVLDFKVGDIIEFEKLVDAPLDLRVGRHPVARGAAVRIGERFGFQVQDVADPRDTVIRLGS